ncbi:hypothetical protein, partial [Alkalibacillus haloalkaliphilus]|uniref:hypothetical protein n=1 Tax=Alkalibacillus haloalkaliphilus TaxID=94136 RepID=UPI00293635D5
MQAIPATYKVIVASVGMVGNGIPGDVGTPAAELSGTIAFPKTRKGMLDARIVPSLRPICG